MVLTDKYKEIFQKYLEKNVSVRAIHCLRAFNSEVFAQVC